MLQMSEKGKKEKAQEKEKEGGQKRKKAELSGADGKLSKSNKVKKPKKEDVWKSAEQKLWKDKTHVLLDIHNSLVGYPKLEKTAVLISEGELASHRAQHLFSQREKIPNTYVLIKKEELERYLNKTMYLVKLASPFAPGAKSQFCTSKEEELLYQTTTETSGAKKIHAAASHSFVAGRKDWTKLENRPAPADVQCVNSAAWLISRYEKADEIFYFALPMLASTLDEIHREWLGGDSKNFDIQTLNESPSFEPDYSKDVRARLSITSARGWKLVSAGHAVLLVPASFCAS